MRRILGVAIVLSAILYVSANTAYAQRVDAKVTQLVREGQQFTAEQVEEAEKGLENNPDDLDQRARLIGYYFNQSVRSTKSNPKYETHALWFIEHQPSHPMSGSIYVRLDRYIQLKFYERAKNLWLKHLEEQPNDVRIISNAAQFFLHHDRSRAIALLERACELEPDDYYVHHELGQVYLLEARFGKDAAANAKRALTSLEKALEKSEGIFRFYLLSDVARAAFLAEENDKAVRYAGELIDTAVESAESDWNFGNAVHHGNLILGHVALKKGDVEAAERHLIKAGHTPGSPQLNSFGPNMSLAKALLEKGRKDTVIEYLKLCSKFWNAKQCAAWIKSIEDGTMPNFGANLVY